MSRKKTKVDPVNILLDLIITILIVAMIPVGFLYYSAKSYAEKPSFTQDAQMMGFLLEKRDYAAFIQGRYVNSYNGDTSTDGYNALADYIEAAFNYKIYDAKNYKEKADNQKEIMNDSKVSMGSLTVFADKIDEMMGIEK